MSIIMYLGELFVVHFLIEKVDNPSMLFRWPLLHYTEHLEYTLKY